MAVTCIAIDDEPLALEVMKEYISHHTQLQLITTFQDAIAAAQYIKKKKIDLLFIDINMPDITGLDLVRSLNEPPMVIFTTAHQKFAVEGFELNAIDYLLKPISPERFEKAVNKALEYHAFRQSRVSTPGPSYIFVYIEYRMQKIEISIIEYIESLEDYIRIHLKDGKTLMTLMTLKGVLEKLPPDKFKRIHRSYIVALDSMQSVLNRKIKLNSGTELPLSESYLDVIQQWKKQ
jgi:two-component system LytT family response regulator